ncbi:unnamed protein product, partial [Fusarium graminearum]
MKLSAVTLLTLATGIIAAPVADVSKEVRSYASYEPPKDTYEQPKTPKQEKPKKPEYNQPKAPK